MGADRRAQQPRTLTIAPPCRTVARVEFGSHTLAAGRSAVTSEKSPGLWTYVLAPTADIYGVDDLVTLRSGDRVTLVSVDNGVHTTVFAATVVSHSGNRIDVTLDEPFAATSRPYILVSGEGEGARFIAIGESTGAGPKVPITTLGPWQNAADRRESSRFPTYRPCLLLSAGAATEGHILDLSMHGVAVEATSWQGGPFVLRVGASGAASEIPCETVGIQKTAASLVVVHARFENLSIAEGMAVMELSESIRADFEAAQARLVTARRRPTRTLQTG